jgi:hypothetical protein
MTMPLNAATAVTPQIPPQRPQRAADDDVADRPRHAEVAFHPRPDHRPSFRKKKRLRAVKERKTASDARASTRSPRR